MGGEADVINKAKENWKIISKQIFSKDEGQYKEFLQAVNQRMFECFQKVDNLEANHDFKLFEDLMKDRKERSRYSIWVNNLKDSKHPPSRKLANFL